MSPVRWLATASCLALSSCSSVSPVTPPPESEAPQEPPTWCTAVEEALGPEFGSRGFQCLEVPNFLVTGFYGTLDNPERSDFVNGCFAGKADAAERLRMSVRPVGDLRFAYQVERSLSASGGMDLGFLGPWAPEIDVGAAGAERMDVTVELADAEIRVLSSVGEILGQAFRDASEENKTDVGAALRACLASLCDRSRQSLVYTAKVLAAVPVIRVKSASQRSTSANLSVGGVAGFEVRQMQGEGGGFELRAHEKLNIAAVVERALPALERSTTCDALTRAQTRETMVTGLRQLGLRTLTGRDPAGIVEQAAHLRSTLEDTPGAFSEHEQRDVLKCLEALQAAAREVSIGPPTKSLCHTRDLVEELLSANGDGNRLHDLLTDVAEPLHEHLTTLANEHALPCAHPAFYQDLDGDGFGNHSQMVRRPEAPKGYVVNSLDCYDHNPDARPGQTGFFDHARGDGSFDYDCDGRATPRTDVVAGGCKVITRFGIPIRCWAEPGWIDRAPPCGEQARWFSTCEEGMLGCDEGPTEVKRQACR